MAHPEFVYRIIDDQAWRAARSGDVLPYADIDRRDGFFHLSTFDQLLQTAQRYFADVQSILALKIRFNDIAAKTKFESSAGQPNEQYPHLYGVLTISSVVEILTLEKLDDGRFCATESRRVCD